MSIKGIGILPGAWGNLVDHMVPLCHIMGCPLLVTDREIQSQIEIFYPEIEVVLAEPEDYCLDEVLKPYNTHFYAVHYRMGNGTFHFAEYVSNHKARSVYTLHGNSDKSDEIFWVERLVDEDLALVYGPFMEEFIQRKGIEDRVNWRCVGNYRLAYYERYRTFFDRMVPDFEGKTILYAPTWSSPKGSVEHRFDYSTFFESYPYVLDAVPEGYQVVVKHHPFMKRYFPDEVMEIEAKYENHPQVYFLPDFPLIYPLLQKMDIYLGDFSAVGYDFLYFDRPLFFLGCPRQTSIQKCGVVVEDLTQLYSDIEQEDPKRLSAVRQAHYEYAFGPARSIEEIRAIIEEGLASAN